MRIDYTGIFIIVMSILCGVLIEPGAGPAVAIISMLSVVIDRIEK